MARSFAGAFRRELAFLRGSRWDLALSTWFPVLVLVAMALLFINGTPRDLPVAVVDLDHSTLSREMTRELDAAQGIAVVAAPRDMDAALPLLRSAHIYAVFLIPKNSEREVKAGRQASFVLFDNTSYYTASSLIFRDSTAAVTALGAKLMRGDVARGNLRAAQASPVSVQPTTLFNPFTNYEFMIVSLLLPSLIVIFLTCAVMTSVCREYRGRNFGDWIAAPRFALPALLGKVTPYFLIYFVMGIGCFLWLALWRGFSVAGSAGLLLFAYALMLAAYTALAALMSAAMRDPAMTLGAGAVYASSAIAFSGALFPMRGAPLFAQAWSAIQPYTAFAQLQLQQWQMGAPISGSLGYLGVIAAGLLVCAVTACILLAIQAKSEGGTP